MRYFQMIVAMEYFSVNGIDVTEFAYVPQELDCIYENPEPGCNS